MLRSVKYLLAGLLLLGLVLTMSSVTSSTSSYAETESGIPADAKLVNEVKKTGCQVIRSYS